MCWYNGNHGYVLFVCLSAVFIKHAQAADYTLGMDSETSCTKTHYYEAGDVFTASVNSKVHNGHCPLTFIQSGNKPGRVIYHDKPCLSLCVKIVSYRMESCQVRMAYHDGLNDFAPVTFDCHTFPPVMWCSSKNDLKVTVSQLKTYDNKNYAITLEIKPFCGSITDHTTDSSVVSHPRTKSNAINRTAIIIGAFVGTISILFVLGWLFYCYKHRNGEPSSLTHSSHSMYGSRTDRNTRATTPNQQTARYAAVDKYQGSSQSSSERGVTSPNNQPVPDQLMDRVQPAQMGVERRLYSPFQPPQPSQRAGPFSGLPGSTQVLYSDLDRGVTGGDKWYPATMVDPAHTHAHDLNPPSAFGAPGIRPGGATDSSTGPMAQYMTQNQVYNYPQFNNADGEMHTVPTDTRYVVYDFDYESQPNERKYSLGKGRNTPSRDSPLKDKPREITPLREMGRRIGGPGNVSRVTALPTLDSTTTDHTDSSFSETTEDDTTDDGVRYNFAPPFGYRNEHPTRPTDSSTRLYDPRNFQRVDSTVSGTVVDVVPSVSARDDSLLPSAQIGKNISEVSENTSSDISSRPLPQDDMAMDTFGTSGDIDLGHDTDRTEVKEPLPLSESAKEGPMPQVPTMPKDFPRSPSRAGAPREDLPWPHGPPPPYSPADRFEV